MKSLLTCVRRAMRWSFLALLLLHVPFILNGLVGGFFWARELVELEGRMVQHYRDNMETARRKEWFSIPGGPGILDSIVAPYFIPQLHTPADWWIELGLERFDLPSDAPFPISRLGNLEAMYRRTRPFEKNKPWQHWVYLSNGAFELGGRLMDPWDEAFDELLRYRYSRPELRRVGFDYLDCTKSCLCDIWNTRGPGLLHLTTQEVQAEPGMYLPERSHVRGYEPVMARIIEFPILSPDHLPLPPGAFPSMFQQLRSIVEEPRAWAMFWPNDPLHQWILRMGELMPKKLDEHPLTFGLLEDAVSHITSFFGQDTLLAEWLLTVQGAVWMLTPVVTDTVVLGYGKVYRQLKEFIGYPDKEKEPRRVDNAMDHVVEEFMDDAQNRLGMDWNDDGYDGLVT